MSLQAPRKSVLDLAKIGCEASLILSLILSLAISKKSCKNSSFPPPDGDCPCTSHATTSANHLSVQD